MGSQFDVNSQKPIRSISVLNSCCKNRVATPNCVNIFMKCDTGLTFAYEKVAMRSSFGSFCVREILAHCNFFSFYFFTELLRLADRKFVILTNVTVSWIYDQMQIVIYPKGSVLKCEPENKIETWNTMLTYTHHTVFCLQYWRIWFFLFLRPSAPLLVQLYTCKLYVSD